MKVLAFVLTFYFFLISSSTLALAIYNPQDYPNNKVGVHILDVSEVEEAATLVNSSGGEWGYVTVPIQPTDRDVNKWQSFLDRCGTLHLIPIIRITTIPLGGTWAEGEATDLVDFANFLAGLKWPTGNRYIVLFNEVNRDLEWGGTVDPAAYAEIIRNAGIIFKERSADFFLLGPALDSALPNSKSSLSAASYLLAMQAHNPAVWGYLDGWASHSYPNPAFRASPSRTGWTSIVSYLTETSFLRLQNKPVFITETGWDISLPATTLTAYWNQAWNIWNRDARVIAVTPFVLQGGELFKTLSLIGPDNNPTPSYDAILKLAKVAGTPGADRASGENTISSTTKLDTSANQVSAPQSVFLSVENFFRRLFGLLPRGLVTLKGQTLKVEVALNEASWSQGLSGRPRLDEGQGMLFVFPSAHIPAFWMKDMQFPLDIVWINSGQVVAISENVPVPSGDSLPTYSPPTKVDMVLELPAGYAAKSGLALGDYLITVY